MIPHGVEVFVGLEPIDLRWGFDRLSGIVAERLTRDVRGGALFVFFGNWRDALKVLFLRDWLATRSRLDAAELERELGTLTVPPSAVA